MGRDLCHACLHDACLGSVGACTSCARHGGPCAPWDAPVARTTIDQQRAWLRAIRETRETLGIPPDWT